MIGIYKITNNVNGHSYIGLSTNIENRWKDHRLEYNWKRENNRDAYQTNRHPWKSDYMPKF